MNKKILLHACCAPCSGSVVERLQEEGYEVVFFWCNPNIYPLNEEEMRLLELEKWAKKKDCKIIKDDSTHQDWLSAIQGLEKEKEGGARCTACFIFRLARTAKKASELGIDLMATTLTNSRYKNAELINALGTEIAKAQGVKFLDRNWKKDGGEMRTLEIAKEEKFYRQKYCGCEFSKK